MGADFTLQEFIRLNQTFADLYSQEDCVKAFNDFLLDLKKIVPFEKGDIYFYRQEQGKITFEEFIFVDWEGSDLELYLGAYCDLDDVLPIVSNKQPIMFRTADIFIASEREKTQYYSELLNPIKMQSSIEGNIWVGDDGHVGGIGIHRSKNHPDFSQKDLEVLKLARPHLANIANRFMAERERKNSYLSALPFLSNAKDLGICIWDFDLRLIDSNLETSLSVPPPHKDELIRSLLTLCRGLRENMNRNADSAMPDSESRMQSKINIGNRAYFADVAYSPSGSFDKGRFIAMIYDFAGIFSKILMELQDKYHLTEREFEVLQCMLSGMNNQTIAGKLFISVPTVKKHLTSMYQKMGIEGKHQIFNAML